MPKTSLLSGAEIRSFRAASRVHGTLFSAGLALNAADTRARVALVVSKKVSPKAAVRNALKRKMREVLRGTLRTLPPVRLVFTAKAQAAGATMPELRADLTKMLDEVRTVAARAERVTMRQS